MNIYRVQLNELGSMRYVWSNIKAQTASGAISRCEFLAPSTKYPNGREWIAQKIKVAKVEVVTNSN